jgi:hypothetical protein
MLKVNVGLSRKLSRDYNSTGFSLNLEGEICVGLDDPEAMIEKVKEFYDLAEEALNQQVERYEGESAIGSRDERRSNGSNTHPSGQAAKAQSNNGTSQSQNGNGQGNYEGNGQLVNSEAATNKQVQYLLNLGKRQGLTPSQLEGRIEGILGKRVGVYELTKREAGDVIDALNQNGAPVSNANGHNRTSR